MEPVKQSGFWRLLVLIARALRLRCPTCGRGKIFRGWFTMNEACPNCGRKFMGDAGFFLGSIYFNYGVTALLVIVVYFGFFFSEAITDQHLVFITSAIAILFPVWFFRYARALWLSFDELWDPAPTSAPPVPTDPTKVG